MKIVVVGDNHGHGDMLEYVLRQYRDICAYIHCGDIGADPGALPRFTTVGGSNNTFYDCPDEQILSIETHRTFIVYPHQFIYSCRSQQLVDAAEERGCGTVYYGHTHTVVDETVDGIRLINPKSLW